jgi:hemoglobin-like flavoprotein
MDFRQIALVQDSFAQIIPLPDEMAAYFYDRLFALAPEVRPLFKGDMAQQGRKLVLTLATIVNGLEKLDRIMPAARELAIRHVRYGVKEKHYDLVGSALLDTLRAKLGSAFDRETEAAWAEAYQLLSTVMIEAGRKAA